MKLVYAMTILAGLAQLVQAQDTHEYELHVIEPSWDENLATSDLSDVLDNGVARGSTTVRIPRDGGGGYRIIDEIATWSVRDGWTVRPGLTAMNNRGDEVIQAPNNNWATIMFSDGREEVIFPFPPHDVAINPGVITENGLVAGCSLQVGSISQGTTCVGFFWTEDRGMVHLRDTGLVPLAVEVRSANADNEMVGVAGPGQFILNQAFYFNADTNEHIRLHDQLNIPDQVQRSVAQDINDHGVVVGWRDSAIDETRRGFRWSRDGGVELLPTMLRTPRSINNHGQIVGSSWLYTPDEGMVNLHTLADMGTFTIGEARDISDTGIIVGWGRREGSGIATAFMLVPTAGICPADLNDDGNLDFFDISDFLSAFDNQQPLADFNGDGNFDFFDVSDFLQAFNSGCP